MYRKLPESHFTAYPDKGKRDGLIASDLSKQLAIFSARATNNSGGAATVGICKKLLPGKRTLYGYVAIGTVTTALTEPTVAAPATIFAGANNDGYLIQSDSKFSLFGFTIATAQANGVFTYKYWNGSAFTTLTTLEVPTDYSATGDNYVVFNPPIDWVAGGTGVSATRYAIQVISTTAPAGAVTVSAIWQGQFLEKLPGISDGQELQVTFWEGKPYLLNGSESLFPYFSVPAAGNTFGAYFVSIDG